MRLSERATPGPWESASRGRYYVGQQEDEGGVHGADDTDIDEVSNVAPLHLADTIRGDCYFPDADLIAKAVNFIRAHAAEIEAMARDAERYRWLRDDAPDEWEINRWVGQTMQEVLIDPSELDAAIDAAMRSAKEDGR